MITDSLEISSLNLDFSQVFCSSVVSLLLLLDYSDVRWVVCRFGWRLAGCDPGVLQTPLPETPDAGEELQHQGQVRTVPGTGSRGGGEGDDEYFSSPLCPLRVLDEILQKLVHLVQEEDCVS